MTTITKLLEKKEMEIWSPTTLNYQPILDTIEEWLNQELLYINEHYPKEDAYWNGRRDEIKDLIEKLRNP